VERVTRITCKASTAAKADFKIAIAKFGFFLRGATPFGVRRGKLAQLSSTHQKISQEEI